MAATAKKSKKPKKLSRTEVGDILRAEAIKLIAPYIDNTQMSIECNSCCGINTLFISIKRYGFFTRFYIGNCVKLFVRYSVEPYAKQKERFLVYDPKDVHPDGFTDRAECRKALKDDLKNLVQLPLALKTALDTDYESEYKFCSRVFDESLDAAE